MRLEGVLYFFLVLYALFHLNRYVCKIGRCTIAIHSLRLNLFITSFDITLLYKSQGERERKAAHRAEVGEDAALGW
jgi:hypothetical protein